MTKPTMAEQMQEVRHAFRTLLIQILQAGIDALTWLREGLLSWQRRLW